MRRIESLLANSLKLKVGNLSQILGLSVICDAQLDDKVFRELNVCNFCYVQWKRWR